MSNDPVPGDFVKHEKLGVGKVISSDGIVHRVYFKGMKEPNPDERTRRFQAPSSHLAVIDSFPDKELDNLPPWKGDGFTRAKTAMSLDAAKTIFSNFFSSGFNDIGFVKKELQYKRSAHDRYLSFFADPARTLAVYNDPLSIAQRLETTYGDPKASKEGPDERLNLLDPRYEAPAYFDAIKAGGEHTSRFADAALDFIESGNKGSFDRYVAALTALPIRKGGTPVVTWPCFTWLPFIAAPQRHFFIKPTIVKEFASVLPFDIHYLAEINYRTYVKCVDMACCLGEILEVSELNLSKRKLDMIDVQSFMWVVEKYRNEGGFKASSA